MCRVLPLTPLIQHGMIKKNGGAVMQTGIQVSSFKPVLTNEAQVQTAFARMKAMDCRWVQLQWIDPSIPIEYTAQCLTKMGIKSVGVQDFYEVIRQNRPYYMELNEKTGGTWMCVSRIPERLKSREGLQEFVDELRQFQSELTQAGQKLCFHPVSADFAPIGGINPVEFLLDAMPELKICADLYHISRCYADVPGWLYRYVGRVCMVHFKDEKDGKLVPPGQGAVNWTGVIPACIETKIPYAFVEQETWDRDPFVCLEEGLQWLNGQIK